MNGTIGGVGGAMIVPSTITSKRKKLWHHYDVIVFIILASCEVPSEPWFQLGPNSPNCLWNGSPPSQCCTERETERCGFRELESCICQKKRSCCNTAWDYSCVALVGYCIPVHCTETLDCEPS